MRISEAEKRTGVCALGKTISTFETPSKDGHMKKTDFNQDG